MQISTSILRPRFAMVSFVLLSLTGVGLRLYQYLMGRSLWEDETHLALNVMKYDFIRLMEPLDFIQGAPILFLWVAKAAGMVFGYSELALRAYPFFASVLTLPLLYPVILNITKSTFAALAGLAIFALNSTLIYYSSEFKPYALDVSASILLVYLTVSVHPFVNRHRYVLLTIAGSLAIFTSLSAFIILFFIAAFLLLGLARNGKINPKLLLVLFFWLLSFLFNYYVFIHNHPSTALQRTNFASSFCPANPFSTEFYEFISRTGSDIMFDSIFKFIQEPISVSLLVIVTVVGLVGMFRKRNLALIFFSIGPIVLHLLLSALHIYPFISRLILYLTPSFILVFTHGTGIVSRFLSQRTHLLAGMAFCFYLVFAFSFKSLSEFPPWNREIKPAIAFVNESLPYQHIYMADPIHAYMYYHERGIAKRDYFKAIPWTLDTTEFYNLVAAEKSNYVLFYNAHFHWGYGRVLEDLRKKGLIERDFSYGGFQVSEVRTRRSDTANLLILDHTFFNSETIHPEDRFIAMWWSQEISTKPVRLEKGFYRISIISKGDPAMQIYPHLHVFANDSVLGNFHNTAAYEATSFLYTHLEDSDLVIKVKFDNDTMVNGEDRNVYLQRLEIKKLDQPGTSEILPKQ